MEECKKCKFCGCKLTEENKRYFDGVDMCKDCFNKETTTCCECGTVIWIENAEGDENIILCESCYDRYYTHCACCGRLIYIDDASYRDDTPYCSSCYDETSDDEDVIHAYGYKPEPIFYGSGNLFLGVELEIDKGGEYSKNAEALLDIANNPADRLYAKHDGSINEGFELVSHPMTLDYHVNQMNWLDVFNKAVDMGYRSHQTQTCGLHCHVNRSAFGKTNEQREAVIARIVYLVENHWNEILKFSRRTEANINRWASRYGISENTQDTYKKAKDKCLGRYVAVNLENYSTVEFRMFRGTLRYKSFIASLQLVDEICNLAIRLTDKELEGLSWSDFVLNISKSDMPELIEYLKAKQLYVNEIVTEEEEM